MIPFWPLVAPFGSFASSTRGCVAAQRPGGRGSTLCRGAPRQLLLSPFWSLFGRARRYLGFCPKAGCPGLKSWVWVGRGERARRSGGPKNEIRSWRAKHINCRLAPGPASSVVCIRGLCARAKKCNKELSFELCLARIASRGGAPIERASIAASNCAEIELWPRRS